MNELPGIDLFFQALFDNGEVPFVILLIFFTIAHYLLFKNFILSVLDPLFLYVIAMIFYWTDMSFMYFRDITTFYYYCQFVLTQGLFTIMFIYVGRKKFTDINNHRIKINLMLDEDGINKLYFISITIFILAQGLSYYLAGIPLFMESRLETYSEGGGVGVLGRIIPVTMSMSGILAAHNIIIRYKARMVYGAIPHFFIIILLIAVCLLSGSRAAVLNIFGLMYLYFYFLSKNPKYLGVLTQVNRISIKILLFSVTAAIIVILVSKRSSEFDPLETLIRRFIQYGDAFMMAYTSNHLDQVEKASGFLVMFSDPLGMFRIIDWVDAPVQIGRQLFQNQHSSELAFGPNAVHSVFGLFYFGFIGSIIFSITVGVIAGFGRGPLKFLLPFTVIGGIIYSFISSALIIFLMDPSYAILTFSNFVFFGMPLIIISTISTKRNIV